MYMHTLHMCTHVTYVCMCHTNHTHTMPAKCSRTSFSSLVLTVWQLHTRTYVLNNHYNNKYYSLGAAQYIRTIQWNTDTINVQTNQSWQQGKLYVQ